MTYRIEYLSTFQLDVSETAGALSDYPQKAKRIFEKLDRILLSLNTMPRMYPIYEDFPLFRKIVIEDYVVFYKVIDSDRVIELHRFIYGKTNYETQFT